MNTTGVLWTLSKWAFVGLLFLLASLLISLIFVPSFETGHVRPVSGCYWTDRLVSFVDCVGFPGSKTLGVVLSLPLQVFSYAPAFLVHSLLTGGTIEYIVKSPQGAALQVGLTMWLVLGLAWPIRWATFRAKGLNNGKRE